MRLRPIDAEEEFYKLIIPAPTPLDAAMRPQCSVEYNVFPPMCGVNVPENSKAWMTAEKLFSKIRAPGTMKL